jgi:hypothetical protein
MLLAKLALAGVAALAIYKMGKAQLLVLASQLMSLVMVYNLGLAAYVMVLTRTP